MLKDNRILSNAARGIAAGLAPEYAGPYLISEIAGHNAYRLTNQLEELIEPIYAKDLEMFHRSLGEQDEAEKEEAQTTSSAQPPRDRTATCDPPHSGLN